MDLYIFDKSFNTVAVIDEYESFNWTDRYNKAGDFELILLISSELLSILKADYYVYFSQSDHLMIIEGVEIKTDEEKGDRLIVTGRSLESILERRIIWKKTKFNIANNFQHGIVKLVINALSTPDARYIGNDWATGETAAADRRRLSNFIVHRDWSSKWLPIKMDAIEYWGENLYDTVSDLCASRDPEVGFKITWRQSDNTFHFYLYLGADHSSDNTENNLPVSFSPQLENIFDTDYYESVKGYKTTALIVGQYPKANQEEEEVEDKTTWVCRGRTLDVYTGLYRRELFCDARNVPYKDDDTKTVYSWASVKSALQDEGKKALSSEANKKATTFEGEVDYRTTYEYGVDYKLGDIVDVSDIYGHEAKARIVEVTFSDDEEGFSTNPTFEMFGEVMGGE